MERGAGERGCEVFEQIVKARCASRRVLSHRANALQIPIEVKTEMADTGKGLCRTSALIIHRITATRTQGAVGFRRVNRPDIAAVATQSGSRCKWEGQTIES